MSTIAQAARGKSSQVIVVRVPAAVGGVPGHENAKATGRYLYVISAPSRFKLKIDNQPFIDAATGTSLECDGEAVFETLEFENPTTEPMTVKVYVGFATFRESSFAVVEAALECDGANATEVGANASIDFLGTPTGFRLHRKAIQVFNGDPNVRLQVRDSDGHRIALVFPESGVKLEGAGFFRVHNPNPGAVDVAISEIWALRPQ